MNLWFGKAAFILGFFAIGYFRDPHIKRNKSVKIVEDRKNKFDIALLVIVTLGGVILPLLWMAFDTFSFANYPLHPFSFATGLALLICGLWLFKRSHDDLGTNWSVSLQVKESHQVIKNGIYKAIRHPMYSSLFLYSSAQIFLLPNWIVGPAGVVTFAILYFGRVKSEEAMMLDKFGDEYRAYMASTKRLIPGVW
jgi:protein-S-isoprenylcysteine O-methyltransferase Ste14